MEHALLFQRATEVAIHALVFLGQQPPGKLSPTHEIAAAAGVPEAYLAKILQRLSVAGLVRTFRGSGKGIELGRSPDEIELSSVVVAAQGSLQADKCILGLPACSEEHPCSLHYEWLPHRAAIQELLDKTTVADLVRFLRQPQAVGQPSASDNSKQAATGTP